MEQRNTDTPQDERRCRHVGSVRQQCRSWKLLQLRQCWRDTLPSKKIMVYWKTCLDASHERVVRSLEERTAELVQRLTSKDSFLAAKKQTGSRSLGEREMQRELLTSYCCCFGKTHIGFWHALSKTVFFPKSIQSKTYKKLLRLRRSRITFPTDQRSCPRRRRL